ncbi:hypothetical protein GCM10009641_54480 [Mycobacterium cookii]|uniref:PE cleavage protein A C-terminal domain-containing protein n=1 Tax=Mycobacterium cookii TaxID=1775 RepID=A0A7I7KSR0_9MYCO|nr:PecA family PE domain-processing aspartic protease [Mycobacterium cookii]MCV7332510.1 PecA family PE domain-processing aspartic protease [Mycobacterium cookii]BBX44468.1 hypothetical protein MCOO_04830 [Mycobacterium cookii]
MVGRESAKNSRSATARRCGVVVGGAVSAFVAAAAMATGSAAPAKADFEALIDPIIQPLLTSFTDSLAALDPAAALDITSWTDSLLSSLGSIDLALPSVAEPAAAAASSSADAAASTGGTIPLTVLENTEPAVNASIDGGSTVPLLVDTGSSGLVVPWQDLGTNNFQALDHLFQLGAPTGISQSGYSGGVDYFYLTYNSVPVDYAGGLTTTGPVDVEVYSWDPNNLLSLFTNNAFQNFLTGNAVQGILGIGENTAGPTTSPFESFNGVLVDIPNHELVVGADPLTGGTTVSGDPISTLYETVSNSGTVAGGSAVSNDVDSGGVYGTIPSSLAGKLEPGSVISVYNSNGGTLLYQYTLGNDSTTYPTSVSGNSIDSGVAPFLQEPIYLDYINHTQTFYPSS